ncbi:MAG TPA: OmpW family outer membrane protein [Noviherbaspirillum sp.]|uniref:OmpW/AlkL family protein n=1 Tax=Noviherbaspirillum sp. TaxID=1926288 RepID=UPI002D35DD1D|nr:OmpW family outer membrane protein [Noviherbaspirillum sp.]HYD96025.1 OmpW family outer membrane protein [Noviherbaspirillum sp.]
MKKTILCLAAGLLCASAQAQVHTVRIGIAHLDINSKSDNFTTNGPAFLTPQPAGITVGDATTLVAAYTRKLSPNLDLDVVLGIPPRHDVFGRGTLAPFGVVAKVKQASPTVFVNYNFGDEQSKLRPFVGVGINYTRFFNRQSTAAGDLASGGPTRIKLTDSWGLAAQAGLTYKLDERWSVSGSVAAAKVKSDLTATTGSIERKTSIDFRPLVVSLCVGYSF